MKMYEIKALSEDMQREIYRSVVFADNEDDALDQMQELLQEKQIEYGICLAEEIS